ncbi:MAG: FecR family protein [Sphingomonas sp.]
MSNRDEIIDEAIAWQQAIARDDGVDWEAFTHWLEADANRRAVFDEVASIDAAIDEHRSAIRLLLDPQPASEQLEAANDVPKSAGRRWFIGTGIAAALALAVGLPLIQSDQPGQTDYATAPGKTRSLALADGSQLALSADSAISVAPRQHRVTMVRGAAYFDVPHDPARQLVVTAGGYRIADIGTRFSVDLAGDRVSIAVAEGNVTVTPPIGDPVRLAAGDALSGDASAPPRTIRVAPQAVASWRRGRLIYDNAPLSSVTSDISRYTGKRIDLAAALDGRRFSGVLVIGDGSHLVPDLAAVAGLAVERDGARTTLAPAAG